MNMFMRLKEWIVGVIAQQFPRKVLLLAMIGVLISGCSTTGGIYSSSDPKNNEFSVGKTVLSVLAAVAVVAVARGGGGGGYPSGAAEDSDWAWDQFNNEYRQLVWACRGKQTGQFAESSRCQYKPVNDYTWPSK